jgi:hypothetical protein
MDRPLDPILKTLAELSPPDWLPFAADGGGAFPSRTVTSARSSAAQRTSCFAFTMIRSICCTWISRVGTSIQGYPCDCGCIIVFSSTVIAGWC